MEVQDSVVPAEVAAEQQPVAAASTPAADMSQSAAPAQDAPPAYTPNFKYKVRDKEFEIDEEVRPLIKDKDSEAKWRRMYEKANGLDYVVQDKEALSKQYNEYKAQYEPIVGTVKEAFEHWNRGDRELAFQKLGIKDEDVMKYVYDKLTRQELPPEQRSAIERATQLERENLALKSKTEQYQSQVQEQMAQHRTMQLESSLSQPEVKSVAELYDQSQGQGAFKQLVIFKAQQHYAQTGQDLSAQEAALMTAKLFPQLSQSQAPSQAQDQVVAPNGVPVIPVARGGGVSTVKKRPTSIADLEKAYAEML